MIILGTNSIKDTGFDVDNSLRFNSGSSDNLSKTYGANATDGRKATFSCWVKRGKLGTRQQILTSYDGGAGGQDLEFEASTDILSYNGGSGDNDTNMVFRDTSAWYHIVVAQDTTQSSAATQVKIYVNGVQQSLGTNNGVNVVSQFGKNGEAARIGSNHDNSTHYFDGYISEFVFIDGQQLAPTSFGEFDEDSGIWKPKNVSGLTFGTNGFYLEFKQAGTSQNSSGMGADTSGNDNHFAVTNLTAIDQTTDTCTNNFATLNPLDVNPSSAGDVFTEGNLKLVTNNNSNAAGTRSNIAVSSGKWYAEVKYTSATAWNGVAAMDVNFHTSSMGAGTISWYQGRTLYVDGSNTANWGSAVSAGDIVGIALDMDNSRVTISQGGQWWGGSSFNQAQPNTYQALTSGYDTWGFMCRSGSSASTSEWNFGSPPYAISSSNTDGNGYGNFEYAVPSGYYALNTKNLAEYG